MEMVNVRCEVIEAICAQLQQDNDRTRWSAVKSLNRLGAREGIPALMTHLHCDPDPDVRMEIACALGQLGAQSAIDALMTTLCEDPDEDVRIQACRALGQLRSPDALETLIDCLTGDVFRGLEDLEFDDDIDFGATWEIQREALEGLGRIGDPRAVEPIIQLMASDDVDDLEELGLRVLGVIGGDRAIGFLLSQLQEGSALTRCRAVRALSNVDMPIVRQPLMDALKDSVADVRLAAGWALVAQSPDAAVPELAMLLRDRDAAVRLDAANMLATYRDDTATDRLLRLLHDPDRDVQLQVIQILEDRLEPRAIAPMLSLLTAPQTEPAVTAALVKALGVLRASEALEPICRLLDDASSNSMIRLQAALALGDIATAELVHVNDRGEASQPDREIEVQPAPVERLAALVDDEDPQVCRAALLSLSKLGVDVSECPGTPYEVGLPDPDHSEAPDSYPTSTLEAIERANRAASFQADAARQQQHHKYASGLKDTIERADANPRDNLTIDNVMANLQDDDRNVQRAALDTLARLQDRSVIEPLRALLFAHGGTLWPETLSTLLALQDSELVTRLLTVLEQPEEEEHHWIAVEAIAEVLLHRV